MNNLLKLRQAAGMSRRALAEASGTTARSIRAWEEETRALEMSAYISIIKLAAALKCEPADLFKEAEEKEETPENEV